MKASHLTYPCRHSCTFNGKNVLNIIVLAGGISLHVGHIRIDGTGRKDAANMARLIEEQGMGASQQMVA